MSNNKNICNNRLCLKNVPISMTKCQILSIFFPELENIEIFFPKSENLKNSNSRFVFVQLKTKNEAILCMKYINRIAYENVKASFAETKEKISAFNSSSIDARDAYDVNMLEMKKCSYCGEPDSEFVCTNCNTLYFAIFYCSKDHQEKDWIRHKVECRAIPQLKRTYDAIKSPPEINSNDVTLKIDEDLETVKSPPAKMLKHYIFSDDSQIKEGTRVVATFFVTNRIIYIRPLCKEYDHLMEAIKKYSAKAPFLAEQPLLNEYIFAPYGDSFQRGRVQDIFDSDNDGNNVKVQLIDVGSELKLKWQNMKHLNFKIRGISCYTAKVILDDIVETSRDCRNFMEKIMNGPMIIFKIHGNCKNEKRVVLKFEDTGKLLNETINLWIKSFDQSRNFYNISKVPKFSTRNTVKIFVSDSSQLEEKRVLSCVPNEKFLDYFNMMDEIRSYSKNLGRFTPYMPELNEICLVYHNGNWSRGSYCVSDTTKDDLKFILIDRMVDVMIAKKDIRQCPQAFSQFFYTSLCFVEGINDWNLKRIKEKINSEKFIYADVRYDSETQCPVLCQLKM